MASSHRPPTEAFRAILRRIEEQRVAIIEQNQQPQPPQRREILSFYDHTVRFFFNGDEERMLHELAISRDFFDTALNLVNSVRVRTRGRPGFVHTHRDKLLFLIVFLKEGTDALKKLCLPALRDDSSVLRNLHQSAFLFKDALVGNTIEFNSERCEDNPMVSSVVDCTVVEITGPDLPFGQKDEYYSGKHKRHCLKKEVIVNVRSGTAAMVSEACPGSVPDIVVLKRHAEEVNRMLGVTRLLADDGYRGDTHVNNLTLASNGGDGERRARLIVERFFGRLKNVFFVFSKTWELSYTAFDDFFDIACALTNITILLAPLNFDDWEFNEFLLRKWNKMIEEREVRARNRYVRRKTKRLLDQHMVSQMNRSLG